MPRIPIKLAVLLLSTLIPSDLPAQALEAGARVRVIGPERSQLVGLATQVGRDTVWIRWGSASHLPVPIGEPGTRVDVSLGRNRVRNAGRWAVRGAIGGAIFGAASCAVAECGSEFGPEGSPAAEAALWFGAVGLMYGAILGAIFGGEGWTQVGR